MAPTLVNKCSEGSLREPAEPAGGDKREGLDVGGLRQGRLDMPIVRKHRTVAIPDLHAMGSEEGCCHVLIYLAEVPLQGLANRVRPLAQSGQKQELQATGVWQANQLDQRADAQDALEVEKRRRKDLSFARDTVLEPERKCENLSNIVEGSPCSGSRSTDGDLACSEH